MSKHTPTPWVVMRFGRIVEILDENENTVAPETHGERIVRAVNAHEAMKEALRNMISLVDLKFGNRDEDVNALVAGARAALALAEGK